VLTRVTLQLFGLNPTELLREEALDEGWRLDDDFQNARRATRRLIPFLGGKI